MACAAPFRESVDLLASPSACWSSGCCRTTRPANWLACWSDSMPVPSRTASEGVWASRDGERAVLLAQTAALGSDIDRQAAALDVIREEFAAARQR
jgi:predicted exporter